MEKLALVESKIAQLKSSNVLSPTELKVYLNELNSPKLCWLTDKELTTWLSDLLSIISLLTGADVYDVDWKNQLLIMSIEKLFRSSSPIMNLTTKEVEEAFYLNHSGAYGKVHTTYSKAINADYIGNVLRDYGQFKLRPLEKQWEIDKILNPPPEKVIPVYTIDDYKKFIQQDYEWYKEGNQHYILMVHEKYMVMRKLKIVIYPSKELWKKWYQKAMERREWEIKQERPVSDADKLRKKNAMKMYNVIKTTNFIPNEEHVSIIRMLRRLVYLRFLQLMMDNGIKDIFNEVAFSRYDKDWGIVFEKKVN